MDLNQLTDRAMQIRDRYAALERARGRRAWSREDLMLGFVGDVGDLAKLVMAKEGLRSIENVDAKLPHELADCLWSILVLARLHRIDLESAFVGTMDTLQTKLNPRSKSGRRKRMSSLMAKPAPRRAVARRPAPSPIRPA